MNFIQLRNSFKFNNNLIIADKIRNILLLKRFSFIRNSKFNFPLIRNSGFLKLKF